MRRQKLTPMSRRNFLRLSVGATAAALLASNNLEGVFAQEGTPIPRPTPIPGLSGEIVLWGWKGGIEHFQAAIPDFQKLYPNVTVRIEEMSYEDTHTNVLAAINTGVGVPDATNFDTSLYLPSSSYS